MADKNDSLDSDQDSVEEESWWSKQVADGSYADKQKVLKNTPGDETSSTENSSQSTATYMPAIHIVTGTGAEGRLSSNHSKRSSLDSKSINWQLSSDTSQTTRGISPPNREWSPRGKTKLNMKKLLVRGKSTKHSSARGKSIKQLSRNSVPISIREVGRSWKRKSIKEKLNPDGEEKVDMERWSSGVNTTTTSERSSWDCSDETDSTTYFEDSLNLDIADVRHKERKVMRSRIRHKSYRWQRSQRRASDDLINALTNELLPQDDDDNESNTDIHEDKSLETTFSRDYGGSSQTSNRSSAD